MAENSSDNNSCDVCFRIACKQCDWVASNEEVEQIQKGKLIACPKCGWQPGENPTLPMSERDIKKKEKLEYLFQCDASLTKYPLLGSAIRGLGKGWRVGVLSSSENDLVFEGLRKLLKHKDDLNCHSERPKGVEESSSRNNTVEKDPSTRSPEATSVGMTENKYNLVLIDGTEKKLDIKSLRDRLLGKTHVMVAGEDKNTDDYDLISSFTTQRLHSRGVIAVTGNGKGKSTTAFGIAMESVVKGGKAAVVQWFKEPKGPRGTWSINEHYFPEMIKVGANNHSPLQFYPTGSGFYSSPEWDRLKGENAYQEHKARAEKGIVLAKQLITSGEYAVIVLDELVDTLAEVSRNIPKSLLRVSEVCSLLSYAHKYSKTKLIVTGRRVTREWEDYINQSIVITEIRHPWSSKKKFAVSGLDF